MVYPKCSIRCQHLRFIPVTDPFLPTNLNQLFRFSEQNHINSPQTHTSSNTFYISIFSRIVFHPKHTSIKCFIFCFLRLFLLHSLLNARGCETGRIRQRAIRHHITDSVAYELTLNVIHMLFIYRKKIKPLLLAIAFWIAKKVGAQTMREKKRRETSSTPKNDNNTADRKTVQQWENTEKKESKKDGKSWKQMGKNAIKKRKKKHVYNRPKYQIHSILLVHITVNIFALPILLPHFTVSPIPCTYSFTLSSHNEWIWWLWRQNGDRLIRTAMSNKPPRNQTPLVEFVFAIAGWCTIYFCFLVFFFCFYFLIIWSFCVCLCSQAPICVHVFHIFRFFSCYIFVRLCWKHFSICQTIC